MESLGIGFILFAVMMGLFVGGELIAMFFLWWENRLFGPIACKQFVETP